MSWQMSVDLKSNPVHEKKPTGSEGDLVANLHKLDEITTHDFGRIGEFIVMQSDSTSLMHGNSDSSVVEQRVSALKDKTTHTNS